MTPGQAGPARRGEAGRSGDDVRSDLRVVIEETGEDLVVDVRSRVEALYGDDIRERVRRALGVLGISAARVTVEDRGAVPWVIAARVEAAARAAGLVGTDSEDPCNGPRTRPPSPRDRLRRSRLYLPGNEPKFMLNAGLHRPDAVILDLEDSVHHEAKLAARILVRYALAYVDFGDAERMVRINPLPLGLADLAAVVPHRPDVILIPKAERPEQIREVAQRTEELSGRGADGAPIWLMPILESALGIENAFAIARASTSVIAVTLGLEDYTADLGVAKTREGTETLWARQRVVNAARAAGVQAIDSVYGDVADETGLRAWARASRAMGFAGMGCVHPRQIRPIHEAFAPTAEELDRARRVVEAYQDAELRGLSVVSLGSKMIDPPVVQRARRLVAEARNGGLPEGRNG